MPRPNRATQRLEASVCRSGNLDERALWAVCAQHFDAHARVPAIGRGVGPASAVYAEQLSFDADGKPYPEHANIIGWREEPGRPGGELKSAWMYRAQRIATAFKYVARPKGAPS